MLAKQVIITGLIEIGLVIFTIYLLTLPRFLTPEGLSERMRRTAYYLGVLFMSITFAWSVILGAVLTLNGVVIGSQF